MEDVLVNQPVVIDNGSGTIKAGIAGEEHPKVLFPTMVGRPKHARTMPGGAGVLDGDVFVGAAADDARGLLRLRYPMAHGRVEDWDDMERVWQHVFGGALRVPPEEHPVLLTEAPLNPRRQREVAAQIMFETFNVPALYFSIQAVLALYATGQTTGLVLDCGDGVSHAVPVYRGFALAPAILRADTAGRDVTEHLQLLLRKQGTTLATSAEKEIVRNIKEKHCYVALDPQRAEKDLALADRPKYRLPDGQVIELGAETFRAPELLFRPHIIGSEDPGVHQLVADSVARADRDLRDALCRNLVLSGGATLTRGFGDRLVRELRAAAPHAAKLRIDARPHRKYLTWVGGSILAGLSVFTKMWVSAEQWAENPDCVHMGPGGVPY